MLAADYLHNAKHRTGQPLNPVARFHLHNGASLYDVHALADLSENGLNQSLGTMVNYLYDLDKVEENHEAYAAEHTLAVSKPFKSLLGSVSRQSENRKVVNG
jgi:malonyl-CoA decarboxylase